MQIKNCTKCSIEKEISEFHKCNRGKFGVVAICKVCTKEKNKIYSKQRYQIYKEKYKTYSKNFYKKLKKNSENFKKHIIEDKNRKLQKMFGITLEQYEQMLKKQNGVCSICGNKELMIDKRNNKPRMLAVDHNHITGQIRGLLCGKCNKMIGLANDNNEILQSAIKYLKG